MNLKHKNIDQKKPKTSYEASWNELVVQFCDKLNKQILKKIKLSYEILLYKQMIQTFEADFKSTYKRDISSSFLANIRRCKKKLWPLFIPKKCKYS